MIYTLYSLMFWSALITCAAACCLIDVIGQLVIRRGDLYRLYRIEGTSSSTKASEQKLGGKEP